MARSGSMVDVASAATARAMLLLPLPLSLSPPLPLRSSTHGRATTVATSRDASPYKHTRPLRSGWTTLLPLLVALLLALHGSSSPLLRVSAVHTLSNIQPRWLANDTIITLTGSGFVVDPPMLIKYQVVETAVDPWVVQETPTLNFGDVHTCSLVSFESSEKMLCRMGHNVPLGTQAVITITDTTAPASQVQASFSLYGVPYIFDASVQMSALTFPGDAIVLSTMNFSTPGVNTVDEWVLNHKDIQIGFFPVNLTHPTVESAFVACALTYVSSTTFTCSVRFPRPGKWRPALNYRRGFYVRFAANTQGQIGQGNANLLVVTTYARLQLIYLSLNASTYRPEEYAWGSAALPPITDNFQELKTFRMVLPMTSLSLGGSGGRGLIFRFIAPRRANFSTDYTIQRVSVGIRSGGNVVGALSGVDRLPSAFPATYTPLTFYNQSWSTPVTATGITYIDSDPVNLNTFCFASGAPAYDLVLTVQRAFYSLAPDLLRLAPLSPAPSVYSVSANLGAGETAAASPRWDAISASLTYDTTRAAVALDSVYLTADNAAGGCLQPALALLRDPVGNDPLDAYFSPVIPRFMFANARTAVTLIGKNFQSGMRVNYTLAPNSVQKPKVYSDLQFTAPSVCTDLSPVACTGTGLYPCTVSCNISSDIPVGYSAYFIVYSPVVSTLISAPSEVGVTVYPDILAGMVLSQQSGNASASFINVTVSLNLSMPGVTAANWAAFGFELGYIAPGYVAPTGGDTWQACVSSALDVATARITCEIRYISAGDYTFMAWFRNRLSLSGAPQGILSYHSVGTGPLSTLRLYPTYTSLFSAANAIAPGTQWQEYSTKTNGGNFPARLSDETSGSLRFFLDVSALAPGTVASSVIMRLQPLSTQSYRVSHVSIALGEYHNPHTFGLSEQKIRWLSNPASSNWTYGIVVPPGVSIDSLPIPLCIDTALPAHRQYNLVVTMHVDISASVNTLLPARAVVDSLVDPQAFWWPDELTTGGASMAAEQAIWTYSDPLFDSVTKLFALRSLISINSSACLPRPNITDIQPQLVAPDTSFTVTIIGTNFAVIGGVVPIVHYGEISAPGETPNLKSITSVCTNVLVVSSTRIECRVGTDLKTYNTFIVTMASGLANGAVQVSWPSQPLLRTTGRLLHTLLASPMSGAVGTFFPSLTLSLGTASTMSLFEPLQVGVPIAFGWVEPGTTVTTPCAATSAWIDTTRYRCDNFRPTRPGAYVFAAILLSNVNLLSSAAEGGAFNAYPVFTPVFLTESAFTGGAWVQNLIADSGRTHRTILPASTLLSSGGNLVMRMRLLDVSPYTAFDRVSLSVGQNGTAFSGSQPVHNAFTPYLVPVLFTRHSFIESVSPVIDVIDSHPIPFCVNKGSAVQADLVFTFHRLSGSWYFDAPPTTATRPVTSFTVEEAAAPGLPSEMAQWDNLPGVTARSRMHSLFGLYSTVDTSAPSSAWGNNSCLVPRIDSVVLGTTLPQQPLLITLIGANFNNGSQAQLLRSANAAGIITALQVSFIVQPSSNTAGTITSTSTWQSFKFGNASLCAGVSVISSTAISCTLNSLTTANVGQQIRLQVFQFGQLSLEFQWAIGLPPFLDVLRNVTVSPQNGKTIPPWDAITSPAQGVPTRAAQAVLVTLALLPSVTAAQFLSSGVLGYTTPAGTFVACTNITVLEPTRVTCGVLPYWQGEYLFQVSFFNGYNSSARFAANGLFRAWTNFGSQFSTSVQYFNNPALAGLDYGMGPQSLPQEPQTYRFTIPKNRFINSSQIALRLTATEGYSVNYVSIGFGLPGRQDVYPNSMVQVFFNRRSWNPSDAAANAAAWAEPAVVQRGFYLDSSPIPFCMLPPNATGLPSRGWDLIVTLHLVSGTEVPVVAATSTVPFSSYNVPDAGVWVGGSAANLSNWSDLGRLYPPQPVTTNSLRSAYLVESLLALDNAVCIMPTITGVYPRNGPALTAITVTLSGSGFTFGSADTPNANPAQWSVTYGIRSSTGSYVNTVLPASTSVCSNVIVLSDRELTCVTANDIGIGQQAEFLLSNGQVGTIYRSYMSAISSEVLTARVPVFSGVLITPQSVPDNSPNLVLTVYLPQNVVGSGINVTRSSFTWARQHDIGFVGTTGSFAPCASVTWVGTPQQESAGCLSCTVFKCLLPANVGPGQYWLQVNFRNNSVSDDFVASAPENYKATSAAIDSSTQFFVAYASQRTLVSTTLTALPTTDDHKGFINKPTGADNVTYTFVPSLVDPGNSPVWNDEDEGATYRFAIPITSTGFSGASSAIVIRMAAQPTTYSFSGMTIGLGSASASATHANQNVFNNTVQPVSFGGARFYPNTPRGSSIDSVVTVRANTTLDSNPIFFCTFPKPSQGWNLIVTLHGLVDSPLPALRSSMAPLPPEFTSFVYNDDSTGGRGYNVSLWNPLLGKKVFPHGNIVAVGIDSIFSFNAAFLPAYYLASMPVPPSGTGLCSSVPTVTDVRGPVATPLYIFPRTVTTVTLTGTNFAAGVLVYYGQFGGFGPVPTNTTTAPTNFINNPCSNVNVIDSSTLTCSVGSNIQRGQTVRFLVFREWLVSNMSPHLRTEVNFVLLDVQGYNGNGYVSPLLPNPFPMQPAFNPQFGQSAPNRQPANYTIAVPYVLDALNLTIRSQLPDTVRVWHIGSGGSLAQAVTAAGSPVWRTILASNNSSTLLTPLAVGNNYFQLWNSVDDLFYTVSVVKASPDIRRIVIAPFPLSVSMASPSLPTAYTPATRQYTMRVPFITTAVNVSVNFTTAWTVAVSLNDTLVRNISELTPLDTSPDAAASVPLTYDLHVGPNPLRVHSVLDGNYSWQIERQDPDTNNITLVLRDVYGATLVRVRNGTVLPVPLSPPFDPTLVTPASFFSLTVAHSTAAVAFLSDYDTPQSQSVSKLTSPADTLGFYIDPAAYLAYNQSRPLGQRVRSQWYNLTVGLNLLQVNSTLDGLYQFQVTRLAPQMQGVWIQGNNLVGPPLQANISAFQGGLFDSPAYALVVGRNIENISVTLWFSGTGANNSIFVWINDAVNSTTPSPDLVASGAVVGVQSGVPLHVPYSLLVGLNYLRIVSVQDGTYTIPITRRTSDIANITFAGYSPTSYPAPVLPFPPLAPAFNPGTATRTYFVTVPFTVWSMRVNVTFESAGTISMSLNGQTVPAGNVLSGSMSPVFNLLEGVNSLVLFSRVEGWYTFNVTRSSSDIVSLSLHNTFSAQDAALDFFDPVDAWVAPRYFFSDTVHFGSARLNPIIAFLTPGSIQMDMGGAGFQQPLQTSPNGIVAYNLSVGTNQFHIASTRDGNYSFTIVRRPADLTKIELRAESVNGSIVTMAMTPAFVPGLRHYYLSLSFKYRALQFRCKFTRSVFAYSPLVPDSYSLVSDSWSESLGVTAQSVTDPIATFDFQIISPNVDRIYYVHVARAVNNVQLLRVFADQLDAGVPGSHPIVFSPPFEAGIYNYSVAMPYAVSTVTFMASLLSNETLRLWTADLLTNAPWAQSLEHNETAGPFAIFVDRVLVLHVSSGLDGDFVLYVSRAAPVMQALEVTPMFPTSPLDPALKPFSGAQLDRPFAAPTGGYASAVLGGSSVVTMNYSMSVPFSLSYIRVVVGFAATVPVTRVTVLNNSTQPATAPVSVYNRDNLTAPVLPLEPGDNTFLLQVDRDGTYVVNVRRSLPDLTNLTLQAYNDSRALLSREVGLYTYIAGALPLTPVALPASKFRPGYPLYAVYVPRSYRFVAVGSLSWTLAPNITLDMSGANSTASQVIVRQFDQRYQTQLIPDSALYALHAGTALPNTLRLNHSIDGTYLFSIYRGERSMSLLNVPTEIQANFSTNAVDPNAPATALSGKGIGLQLSEGLSVPSLYVQVVCDAGTVSPSVLDFGSTPLAQTLFFQYRAPFVAANSVATISFKLLGNDAWQIDPLPSIRLNVFPVNTSIIGSLNLLSHTVPQSVLINSVSSGITVVPSAFSGQPQVGNALVLQIFVSSGSVSPVNLTFTHDNWHRNQSFALLAPPLAANVTLRFNLVALNGISNKNNAEQYSYPSNSSASVIRVLGTVTVDPRVFPTQLYNQQLSPLIGVSCAGIVGTNFSLSITSPSTSLLFNASTLVYSRVNVGGALFFRMQPLFGNLKAATVVYINFALGGADAHNYASLPQLSVLVLPQAFLSVTGVPVALYVGGNMDSRFITVTPSEAPVDSSVLVEVDGGPAAEGLLINYQPGTLAKGSVNPVRFQITLAPLAAQTLTLVFKLSNADAPHFQLPAPLVIPILPKASVLVLGVPSTAFANQAFTAQIAPGVVLPLEQFGAGFSVGVQASPGGGTISPSDLFSFGVGTASSASFSYLPPAGFSGAVTLSYTVQGPDASIYNAIPPSSIAILSQGSFTVTGLPPGGVGASGIVSLSVAPVKAPSAGAVALSLMVDGGATILSASTLTFTGTQAQLFVFRAPGAPTAVTVQWSVGGAAAAEFTQPSPVRLVVLAAMSVVSRPSRLFVKESSAAIWVATQSPSITAPQELFPAYMAVSCSPSTVACSAIPAQIAFPTPAPSSFVFVAPSDVPVGGSVTLNFALIGLAAAYFAPPASISIVIQAQNAVSVSGNTVVYAFDSTLLTLMPSATVGNATVLTFSLGNFPGSFVPSQITLPIGYNAETASYMGPLTVRYVAPSFVAPSQLIPVVVAVSGPGAAQFVAPTFTIDMRGARVLSVCAPSSNLYVTGVLLNEGDWNGVYTASVPINDKPHYELASPTVAGRTYHLFYFVDPSGVYPSAWMLDVDASLLANHANALVNTDVAAPFSNKWTAGQRTAGFAGPSVTTMSVTCGIDCPVLGKAASLETQVCFGGVALRTPITSLPSVCPLSCARYLPSIYSSCKDTPFYRDLPVVGTAITTTLSTCRSCNFTFVAGVMSACGISVASSDTAQDLLNVMRVPGSCTAACAPAFNAFFATCVANQAVVPVALANFNAQCAPAQAPRAVTAMSLVEARANALVLTWPVATQVQLTPLAITYFVRLSSFPYVAGVLPTDTPFWVRVWNGTENGVTIRGLAVNTTYTVSVVAASSAGVGPASASFAFSTLLASPPPPVASIDVTSPFVLVPSQSASLSPTYAATVSWPQTSTAVAGANDTYYRLTIARALDASRFGPALVVSVGFDTSVLYDQFLPGFVYQLGVQAAQYRPTGVAGLISQWGPSFVRSVAVPVGVPNVPALLPASNVNSVGLTLNWNSVFFCGNSSCASVVYEIAFLNNGLDSSSSASTSLPVGSAPSTAVGAITGRWISLVNVSYPGEQPTSSAMSYTWNGASAGSNYLFRMRAVQLARVDGASEWSATMPVRTAGTLPSVIRSAAFAASGSSSIVASWNHTSAFYLDGFSTVAFVHFHVVPASGSAAALDFYMSPADVQPDAQAAATHSYAMSGLVGGVTYQLTWEVRNALGWSGLARSPVASVLIPSSPPRFVSLVARDPSGSMLSFGNGAQLVATFDRPTNKPELSTPAQLNAFFAFSTVVPATLTPAVWSADGTTLTMVVSAASPTATPPVIGVFTARVTGDLRTQALTSPSLATESNALYTTQVLLGSWGSTAGRHLVSATSVSVVAGATVANVIVPQVAPASSTVQYPDSAIVLQLSVSNGQVVYPYNPAVGLQLAGAQSLATLSVNGQTYARLLSTDSSINPLHQIAYTPAPGFYGGDALVVTLTGSFGVEQVSIPLTVLRANHAPVITVPPSARQFDPFDPAGVTLAGLAVSDEDNLPTTPMRVTFSSLSPSAWFAYSAALPAGLTSSLAAGQRAATLTLTGAYAQLVPFLPSVTWFDGGIDPDSSSSVLSVNIRADDLGSGIPGAAGLVADGVYLLAPQCGLAGSPALLRAEFSPDLSAVQLHFDSRVKLVGGGSSQAQASNCANYLSAATVGLLGASPSCYLTGPSVLTVQLGAGFTARVFSPVSLAAGAVRRCISSPFSAAAPASPPVLLLPPGQAVPPGVVLQGPSSVGTCQDLPLTASLANVTGPVQFVWAVDAEGVLPDSLGTSSATLTIPAAKLVPGGTYTFMVYVINILGSSSPVSSLRVVKARRPTPTLLPVSSTRMSVRSSDAFQLASFANLSACLSDAVAPAAQRLLFGWSVVAVPAASLTLDVASRTTSTLSVPAGTLQAGSSYTFTVQATVAGDATLFSTLSFSVDVEPASATIVPSSSSQLVPFNTTIVLPASSLTGGGVDALPLVWTCQLASGAACFNLLTQQPLQAVQLAAGVGLTVAAGTLAPGSYLITATTVSTGGAAGVLVQFVWLTVSPSVIAPLVTVRASAVRVATSDPLTLTSTVLASNGSVISAASSGGAFRFAWSMSPNSSSWSGLTDTAVVPGGLASNTLVINGRGLLRNVFQRGASLRFRLTVTHIASGQFGFAEVAVDVASPPSGGTFTVQPRSGVAGSTVYTVAASGWSGIGALTYKYSTISPLDGSLVGFGSTPGAARDGGVVSYAGALATNYTMTLVLEVSDLSGSVVALRANISVLPNPVTAGGTRGALAAASNAQQSNIQLLSTAGSLSQLVAYISAQSLASQQMLSSPQASPPTFLGVPIPVPYAAPYPRCYPSQMGGAATGSDAAATALVARSVQLLEALVSSVGSVGAAQGLAACLSMANDAGIAVSVASVLTLLGSCQPVASSALVQASTLCTATSVGCFAQQQSLVTSALATTVSMIEAYLMSAASAAAAQSLPLSSTNRRLLATSNDATVLPQLLSLLSSVYDRVTRLLLQSSGQSFFNNDCHVVSLVSRDASSSAFSYAFPDGSTASYPAAWARAPSPTIDTRLSYHAVNPFIYDRTATRISIVSGVLFAARTDSAALVQPSAHPSFAGVFTLRYNRLLVNASFPLCLLWNSATASWSPFSAGGGNVTTRFPSQVTSAAEFVDCIVNGAVSSPVVAAFNSPSSTMGAPLIVPAVSSSSTGAAGGLSSSSTGAAQSSTGPDESLGLGPLGPPPPIVLPADQRWAINATMALSLDLFFLGDSQRPRVVALLLEDLSRATGIARERFQVNSVQPGSLIVNFYVLPSPDAAEVTPVEGWRRLQGQIGAPASAFSNGDVTQAYSAMPAQNWVPALQCADGLFRVECPPASSSSTGMEGSSSSGAGWNSSSTGGSDKSGGSGPTSGSSSGFLGGGTNQLVFIIVVAVLGAALLLLACLALYYRHLRQSSRAKAEEAMSLAGFGPAAGSGSDRQKHASDKSETNVSSSGSEREGERAFTRRTGAGAGAGVHHPSSSASNSPRDPTSSSVQASPSLVPVRPSGANPPQEPAAMALPPGTTFTSVVKSMAAGGSGPGAVQMAELGRPRLEKGTSPSTEVTPENTPRGPRPLPPLAAPSSSSLLRGTSGGARPLASAARGAQLGDVKVHLPAGASSGATPVLNPRRDSFRITTAGGARATGPRRVMKLNPAMIAAASGMMTAAMPAAGSVSSPGSSPAAHSASPPALGGRPGGALLPMCLGPVGLRSAAPAPAAAQPAANRPPSPGSTVLEVDEDNDSL